jgi:hypothetical protein
MVVKVQTVQGNAPENMVVSFDTTNTGKCISCELVAYSSAQEPARAADFLQVISPKDPQVNDNWQNYTFNTRVKTLRDGNIYVALGLRSIPEMFGGVESATGSIGIDNVSISAYPVR